MFKVLLVDDEELALIALKFSVPWSKYGFTKIEAITNPALALTLLKEQRFDAAFVDIRMPEFSGIDLIKFAKDNNLSTQFVFVSGYSDFEYVKQALTHDAFDYCLKPLSTEAADLLLEKLVRKLIEIRLRQDKDFISQLMSNANLCNNYLRVLCSDNSITDNLSILSIRGNNAIEILHTLQNIPPQEIFFLNTESLFLLWSTPPAEEILVQELAPVLSSALFLYNVVKPTVNDLQNALKLMLTETHNRAQNEVGFYNMPTLSHEMTNLLCVLLKFVDDNYDQKLTLQMLAHKFGVNYSYLSQVFKLEIGKSFSEYLTTLRMEHACILLSTTQLRINTISEKVGYDDYHYFCNTFKRHYNLTPLQYRTLKTHRS